MRAFLFSFFFSVVAAGVAACDGEVDQTDVIAAKCSEPPPIAVTTRSGEILRLDFVQLGETINRQPPTAPSLGMNLDGLCSTLDPTTFACAQIPGSVRASHFDGDGGVDNAFGRTIVPLMFSLEVRPSEAGSGTSFLVFEGGGRATLHLGARSGQIFLSIPLTSVRLDEGRLDSLIELAAVIPGAEFRESLRARANSLFSPPTLELCAGSTLEGILGAVEQAQDIPVDRIPNRSIPCDGISIGMRFRATPVTESEMPKLPPSCAEQMAGDAGG